MPELEILEIQLTVNGRAVKWRVEPGETLLEALHAHHLKGTKLICGTGDCCGCGVILNGRSINSLLYACRTSPTVANCSPSKVWQRMENYTSYRRHLPRKALPSAATAPPASSCAPTPSCKSIRTPPKLMYGPHSPGTFAAAPAMSNQSPQCCEPPRQCNRRGVHFLCLAYF